VIEKANYLLKKPNGYLKYIHKTACFEVRKENISVKECH
jgi:hypothetical protein